MVEKKKSGYSLKSIILSDQGGRDGLPNTHKIELEDEDVAEERRRVECGEGDVSVYPTLHNMMDCELS